LAHQLGIHLRMSGHGAAPRAVAAAGQSIVYDLLLLPRGLIAQASAGLLDGLRVLSVALTPR
jgi:hypothetical protein